MAVVGDDSQQAVRNGHKVSFARCSDQELDMC